MFSAITKMGGGLKSRAMLKLAKSMKPYFDQFLAGIAKDGQVLVLTGEMQFITPETNILFKDAKNRVDFDIMAIMGDVQNASPEDMDEFDRMEEEDERTLEDEEGDDD